MYTRYIEAAELKSYLSKAVSACIASLIACMHLPASRRNPINSIKTTGVGIFMKELFSGSWANNALLCFCCQKAEGGSIDSELAALMAKMDYNKDQKVNVDGLVMQYSSAPEFAHITTRCFQ